MNSEKPLTPREELEVRLTALLLGELSAEEAATFEEQIARDPELAATHARLRQAIELLREATAIPDLTAHPTPAALSTERRQKLFQHFSNPERGTRNAERERTLLERSKDSSPSAAGPAQRREWGWLVPLGLAAALIALIGGSLFLNGIAPQKSPRLYVMEEAARNAPMPTSQIAFWDSQSRNRSANQVTDTFAATGNSYGEKPALASAPVSGDGGVLGRKSGRIDAVDRFAGGRETDLAAITSNETGRRGLGESRTGGAGNGQGGGREDVQALSQLADNAKRTALGDLAATDVPAPAPAAPVGAPQSSSAPEDATALAGTRASEASKAKSLAGFAELGDERPILGWKEEVPALLTEPGKSLAIVTAPSATPKPPASVAIDAIEGAIATPSTLATLQPTAPAQDSKAAQSADPAVANDWFGVSLNNHEKLSRSDRNEVEVNGNNLYLGTTAVAGGAGTTDDVKLDARLAKRSGGQTVPSNTMPTKWLYVLKDGSTGAVSDAKETNPIVGRTVFWNDDESTKLSINTASEGAFWNTPSQQQAKAAAPGGKKIEELMEKEMSGALSAGKPMSIEPGVVASEHRFFKNVDADKLVKADVANLTKAQQKVTEQDLPVNRPPASAPEPQPEVQTRDNGFSTFSLNVSDVAFKLAAASLEKGVMPEVATVRSEEFINAFDYRDPEAAAGAPLAFVSERARYPFAQNRDLLRLSVKTAAAGRQPGRPLNLVLLLDNSGSMERADRVRILREALRVLAGQLQAHDKLSIITFARTPRLWADGMDGKQAGEAIARVAEITPQGGTNVASALDLGYQIALKHYQVGSINRVVLLTDGAANLGDVEPDALKQKVEAHRKQGIALDCFGIGWEGYNDDLLEVLSRNGDGRYGFINTPEEAATEFAGQLAGALHVAASDVKVQVEFNPAPRDGVSPDRLREASAHQGAVPRQHRGCRRDRRRGIRQRALRRGSESARRRPISPPCACASKCPAPPTTASTSGPCLSPATRRRSNKPVPPCASRRPRARFPNGWLRVHTPLKLRPTNCLAISMAFQKLTARILARRNSNG